MCLHTVILSPLQFLCILLMETFAQVQAMFPACLTGLSPLQHGRCWPGHTPGHTPLSQHLGSWLPMSFRSAASECLHPRDLLSAAGWARGPALARAAHQPPCCPVCQNLSLGQRGVSFWACPSLGAFSALGTLKYLAVLALINSCHTQDLCYDLCYLLVGACKLLVVAHGI